LFEGFGKDFKSLFYLAWTVSQGLITPSCRFWFPNHWGSFSLACFTLAGCWGIHPDFYSLKGVPFSIFSNLKWWISVVL